MIEYTFNMHADLLYYLLVHMKVENASDTFDEDYITKMKQLLNASPCISDKMIQYYNANFERLAMINFFPLMAGDIAELTGMIRMLYGMSDEDKAEFINPFCALIEEWEKPYSCYWKMYNDSIKDEKSKIINLLNCMVMDFSLFFDDIFGRLNVKLNVVFSHSLRKNGRATKYGDKYIVMLTFPDETHTTEEIFFQLIHECTHAITDPLIQGIRMDDGTHDIAEYQVILFDLWLMEKLNHIYAEKYTQWISKEVLDECYRNLSEEQIIVLKNMLN